LLQEKHTSSPDFFRIIGLYEYCALSIAGTFSHPDLEARARSPLLSAQSGETSRVFSASPLERRRKS